MTNQNKNLQLKELTEKEKRNCNGGELGDAAYAAGAASAAVTLVALAPITSNYLAAKWLFS